MKNIKLASIALIFGSSNVMADWSVNNNSVAAVGGSDRSQAVVLGVGTGESSVFLADMFDTQEEYNCVEDYKSVHVINGQNVRIITRTRSGSLQCNYYPESTAGAEYVLNEFKTKSSVTWGGITYSAMGFNKALKTLEAQSNAL